MFSKFSGRIKNYVFQKWMKIRLSFERHWVEIALVFSFFGNLGKNHDLNYASIFPIFRVETIIFSQPMNTSLLADNGPEVDDESIANTFSNLGFSNNGKESADPERIRALKRIKQKQYVEKYVNIAKKEMKKYGIPASITLAQGLLESNVGESNLAIKNRNHFGLKCFSKTCKRGHCSNFEDDTHKDFFIIFKSAEESYESHSKLLQKDRYKPLFKLEKTDYKNWALGLRKAGYATDPKYGEKLISIIEDLELYKHDKN